MKTKKKNLVIMMAIAIGIVFFPNASLLAQQTFTAGKVRELKYESGVFPLKKETKMKVTVGQDQVTFQPKNGQAFAIPCKSIVEVAYDTKSQRRTAEAAALAAASPLGGMILFAMKKTKHYVSIVWEENGVKKDVIFDVPKGERTSLLDELQRATGKPWRDLDSEQKRTIQELETAKNKGISIQLDRQANIGNVSLKAGAYKVVFLDRGNGTGELHFFKGNNVEPKKSLVAAKVESVNQTNTSAATQVSYEERGGKTFISAIQTSTSIFTITD
jgi:hypothetical protein